MPLTLNVIPVGLRFQSQEKEQDERYIQTIKQRINKYTYTTKRTRRV